MKWLFLFYFSGIPTFQCVLFNICNPLYYSLSRAISVHLHKEKDSENLGGGWERRQHNCGLWEVREKIHFVTLESDWKFMALF